MTESEQRFFADLRYWFPDAREVTEGGRSETGRSIETGPDEPVVPPSVTSQASLFKQETT